jgi:hypothetical protein
VGPASVAIISASAKNFTHGARIVHTTSPASCTPSSAVLRYVVKLYADQGV